MAVRERTWAFDMNRVVTPATTIDLTRQLIWTLAAQLTGNTGGFVSGLWTLYASSDGVTAGTDSTDRWQLAGPYDGTKLVRGASTAAHSWIVLASPTMNGSVWYMTISLNTSADTSIRLWWSKTAPTGGNTTTTPTAADAWTNKNATVATDVIIDAAADASRVSTGLTDAGDFYFLACKQGTGGSNLFITFQRLADYHVSDQVPIWARLEYHATANSHLVAAIADGTTTALMSGPFAVGSSNQEAVARNFANTNRGSGWLLCPFVRLGPSGNMSINRSDVPHPGGGYSDFPCFFVCDNDNAPDGGEGEYIRGRIPDFAICMHSTAVIPRGSGSPFGAVQDSSRAGDLWFPVSEIFNFA